MLLCQIEWRSLIFCLRDHRHSECVFSDEALASCARPTPSVLAFTEAPLTSGEQALLEGRFNASGKNCTWSQSLHGEVNGMDGRSGGSALLFDKEWHILDEGLQLELAAPQTDWCAAHLWHESNRMQMLCVSYYGHPTRRSETMADIEQLGNIAACQDVSLIVMGDLNLRDDELTSCMRTLQDLSLASEKKGHPVGHTFVGPQGASSPDKILAGVPMVDALQYCSLNRETSALNHRMLLAHIQRKVTDGSFGSSS